MILCLQFCLFIWREFQDVVDHLSDPVMHFVYRRLAHERRRRHDPIGGVNVRLVIAFVKEINLKYSEVHN